VALLASPAPRWCWWYGALERPCGARGAGLEVRFVGQLDPGELVGAYNAATCVVHTRPDEVFALALIEALACGGRCSRRAAAERPSWWARRRAAPAEDPARSPGSYKTCSPTRDSQPRITTEKKNPPRGPWGRGAATRRGRYSTERMVRDYAEVLESLV